MLSINSNIPSLFSATNLQRVNRDMQDLSVKIAAGKRIVTAADDPGAIGQLSILKGQASGYQAVMKNLQAGQSLLTVASSSLESQQEILTEMKKLSTEAASDLLSVGDRTALSASFSKLQAQLNDVVGKASIFGQNLTGATATAVVIQSGVNPTDKTTLATAKSDAATLGVATIDLSTSANATAALTAIDAAVNTVATNQATIGAQQNAMKMSNEYSQKVSDNIKDSIGRIEDLDVSRASSQLAMLQTRQQLAIQMLGLTNSLPQAALQLLR